MERERMRRVRKKLLPDQIFLLMMEWFRLKKLTILKAERARQPSRRAVHKVLWMRTLLWTLEPKTIQVYAKPNQSPA
ncbi:hypothetical protein C0995_008037, partial [Termitomyces sp. Mi166